MALPEILVPDILEHSLSVGSLTIRDMFSDAQDCQSLQKVECCYIKGSVKAAAGSQQMVSSG